MKNKYILYLYVINQLEEKHFGNSSKRRLRRMFHLPRLLGAC